MDVETKEFVGGKGIVDIIQDIWVFSCKNVVRVMSGKRVICPVGVHNLGKLEVS